MFAIEKRSSNGFDEIILKDELSQTSVEILPTCGAIIHAFKILHNGETINVIDSFIDEADFKKNVTAKGFKGCKLSPFVCRIKDAKYTYQNKQYSIDKFLLGKHALHGLIYDAVFDVIETTENDNSAKVVLQCSYNAVYPGYPFTYTCTVTYMLQKDNLLTVLTDITNTDKEAIPMQDGWHPYFTFGKKIDELQFEFQSKDIWVFDDMIPTGERVRYEEFGSLKKIGDTFFDNCFTLDLTECQPMCVLRDTEKKLQVELRPEKSYPYLQMYTPDHRMSIALENLSSPPDAFNNKVDLKIMQPGEKTNFTTSYKITSLL